MTEFEGRGIVRSGSIIGNGGNFIKCIVDITGGGQTEIMIAGKDFLKQMEKVLGLAPVKKMETESTWALEGVKIEIKANK
jgi:hypothetical protein